MVVHGEREIVGKAFGCFLGTLFQSRVRRSGHLRHFIDRCGNRGRLAEPFSLPEGLQLITIYRVDHVVKQTAQRRIAIRVIAALQHPVHSVVKVLARCLHVPGFEVLLARGKLFPNFLNQVVFPVQNAGQQGGRWSSRWIDERQRRQRSWNLLCCGSRWGQGGNSSLDRLFGCVLTTQAADRQDDSPCRYEKAFLHLTMVRSGSRQGQRLPENTC